MADEMPAQDEDAAQPVQALSSAAADPLFARARQMVQQGQWLNAEDVLADLTSRYPDDAGLLGIQQDLALHLSAEKTWLGRGGRRRRGGGSVLGSRVVRVLLLGNVVVYLFLCLAWLILQLRAILG